MSSKPAQSVKGCLVKVLARHISNEKARRMKGSAFKTEWVFGRTVDAVFAVHGDSKKKSWRFFISYVAQVTVHCTQARHSIFIFSRRLEDCLWEDWRSKTRVGPFSSIVCQVATEEELLAKRTAFEKDVAETSEGTHEGPMASTVRTLKRKVEVVYDEEESAEEKTEEDVTDVDMEVESTPPPKRLLKFNYDPEVSDLQEYVAGWDGEIRLIPLSEVVDDGFLLRKDIYVLFHASATADRPAEDYWVHGKVTKYWPDGYGPQKISHDILFSDEGKTFGLVLKLENYATDVKSAKYAADHQTFVLVERGKVARKRRAVPANALDVPKDKERDVGDKERDMGEREEPSKEPSEAIPDSTRSSKAGDVWKFGKLTTNPNKAPPETPWAMLYKGQYIRPKDGVDRPLMDYLLACFPPKHLSTIIKLTNARMRELFTTKSVAGESGPMTRGEFLKFLGVLLLLCRLEFSKRGDCWSKPGEDDILPKPQLGRFMWRKRFEAIRRSLTVSVVKTNRPKNKEEANVQRWSAVDDFVAAINAHYAEVFTASKHLCLDESFSRWYGIGGPWADAGLPFYVAFDRKPEAGCEIWSACCASSMLMISVEICKGKEANRTAKFEDSYGHGTAVAMRLMERFRFSGSAVAADSFFASVECAEALWLKFRIFFIGVVKMSTSRFPMRRLEKTYLKGQGAWKSMTTVTASGVQLMAVVWSDRTRRYFISTHGTSNATDPHTRSRWVNKSLTQDEGMVQEVKTIPQPQVVAQYYRCNDVVDRHNRYRQDDLNMEKKVGTKSWSFRVATTLISVIVVNAYLLFKKSRTDMQQTEVLSLKEFTLELAGELVRNTFDLPVAHGKRNRRPTAVKTETGPKSMQPVEQATCVETQKKVKMKNGRMRRVRGYCRVCKGRKIPGSRTRTTFHCSHTQCNGAWICTPEASSTECWDTHFAEHHVEKIVS